MKPDVDSGADISHYCLQIRALLVFPWFGLNLCLVNVVVLIGFV